MTRSRTTPQWLPAPAFAAAFGISERAAQKALSRALDGKPWRGHRLAVRQVPARARAGRALQVHEASLPGIAPAAQQRPAVAEATPADTGAARRRRIIQPALAQPPGSAGRGRAVAEAAMAAGVPERTLRSWIAAYESRGYAGLKRKRRADKGQRRHRVSARWDAAVAFDADTMERIGADLDRYVRSLWAATTEPGERMIARLASRRLRGLTRAAGYDGEARALKAACKVSLRFVRRHSHYRAVAIHDLDAKQWHDRHRPRIRRTRADRAPMELVVGDVHPMDVLLPRAEGGTFTAKLICWQDWATNRIFVHPVFLARGEGVRQEHVAESYIAMTQAPGWGVPQVLYLDNGGEYRCFDLVGDAMALTTDARALQDDSALHAELQERRRTAVLAQPYNAAAKDIEGKFAILERSFFSMMPGWIGGQRMAKKTANVGRAPVPYPHGKAAFLRDLDNCIEAYETHPQSGVLGGRSPREAFAAAVDAGWTRMDIDPGALRAAFARDASRTVRQGAFSYNGERYTAPEIQALPADTRLHLRIPICGGLDAIPVMDADGGLFCIAALDRAYDALDTAGAKDAGRRLARARAGVRTLRADTDALDMRAEVAGLVADETPEPVPDSAGTIRLSEGMEAVGRALERTPAQRRAEAPAPADAMTDRRRAAFDRYLERARAAG